mgnify:FL=1
MKIFKLLKEIQAIREVLTLIFKQHLDIAHQINTMQAQLDKIDLNTEPQSICFEDENRGDVQISKEIYNEMCEYLEEDEINVMGLT